jgi:hypothetical protein
MSGTPEIRDEGHYWVVLGQNPPRSPTGNAASGGCAAMRSRGSRMQSRWSAIG